MSSSRKVNVPELTVAEERSAIRWLLVHEAGSADRWKLPTGYLRGLVADGVRLGAGIPRSLRRLM